MPAVRLILALTCAMALGTAASAADLRQARRTPDAALHKKSDLRPQGAVVTVYLPEIYVAQGCLTKGSCLPPRIVALRHRHVVAQVPVDVYLPAQGCGRCVPPAGLLID